MVDPIEFILKRKNTIFCFRCDNGNNDRHDKGKSQLQQRVLCYFPGFRHHKALNETEDPLHITGHDHVIGSSWISEIFIAENEGNAKERGAASPGRMLDMKMLHIGHLVKFGNGRFHGQECQCGDHNALDNVMLGREQPTSHAGSMTVQNVPA